MERGRTNTTTISDDLAGLQARDLLGTEPQFGQDCRGILPPLRRSVRSALACRLSVKG